MSTANADMIWLTHTKRKVRVGDMATPHLRNAIAMMERELPAHYLAPERNAVPVYAAMKAELEERQTPRIVSAQGLGPYGRYTVQWRVVDGVLQVRHQMNSRSGSNTWRPTATLSREVLEQLIMLYDHPFKPFKERA